MLELFPQGFEERALADELELAAYTDAAGEVRAAASFGGDVSSETVAPGWEDGWRRFHRPVRVGPLWIGPPWEQPPEDAVAVVIDPGRAFGTGAHTTTRLSLELVLGCPRGSLADLGCGSGVLAIAAAKLGFGPVVALDRDPVAVEVAGENARANAVEVELAAGDALADALPAADVTVANIELRAVELLAPRVPSGTLVTSGYLVRDRPAPDGWTHAERVAADGWAADRFLRD
jgi:ribosomal protein L11 methyltransferase